MRRFMRNTGLAALGLAVMATGSLAQENTATEAAATDVANNSVFGDWVMACEAVTVSRNMCRLVQEQSLRETGEMLARFIAVPVADGVILLAQVPMGVYLPGGAVYRFEGQDDVEQREMVWQRCADTVCEAAAPVDEEELARFAEADGLLFGFRMDAQAEPIVLRVDLEQFGEAVDLIRQSLK